MVLCSQPDSLQVQADRLFRCGVKAILNTTTGTILYSGSCRVADCSLSDSLSTLCCRLTLSREDQNAEDSGQQC